VTGKIHNYENSSQSEQGRSLLRKENVKNHSTIMLRRKQCSKRRLMWKDEKIKGKEVQKPFGIHRKGEDYTEERIPVVVRT